MMPNITRGDRFDGLLSYLVGKGRSNEHTDQHMIAGDADLFRFYGGRELSAADALAIAYEIDEARRLMGTEVSVVKRGTTTGGTLLEERKAAHVWHCSLSLSADEGLLSDEQWQAIANDFIESMGFGVDSGKAECRWVAIRHGVSKNGNDHVHLAVSLVRADGTKASTHNDFVRSQKACRELEEKYGLAITGDRAAELGTRGVSPAAREAAQSRGAAEPDSVRLSRMIRASAATAENEAEFVRRARRSGLLIRPRFAKGRDDVVEGYSVALRPVGANPVVWHGGGKLARDLTLPRLRTEWPDSISLSQEAIAEWRAAASGTRPAAPGREIHEADPELWARYTEDVRQLREQLRAVPVDDKATWAIVARESAGVFAAWSQRVEATPGPLADVSRELAKTAQIRAHQVRPRPKSLVSVGSTARLVAAVTTSGDSRMAQALLLRELAKTSQAIHSMIVARGDAVRAQQMSTVVRAQLDYVAARLPKPPAAAPSAAPSAPTSAAPAIHELGRFGGEATSPHTDTSRQRPEPPRRPPGEASPERDPRTDR